MITTAVFYGLQCDRCKKTFEDSEGYEYQYNESDIVEHAYDDGWQEIEGKHYCPDCCVLDEDAEYDDVYKPLPRIPKEIFKAQEFMRFVCDCETKTRIEENCKVYFLHKWIGHEDGYSVLSNAERSMLRTIIGRDFDVDYLRSDKGTEGHRMMTLRIAIPKYGKEIVELKKDE